MGDEQKVQAVEYFVCTKPCWHDGYLYKKGEPARFNRDEDGPHDKKGKLNHFVKVDSLPSGTDEVSILRDELAEMKKLVAGITGGGDDSEPADDQVTCDVCNEYTGSAKQVTMHKVTCQKKADAAAN